LSKQLVTRSSALGTKVITSIIAACVEVGLLLVTI